MRMPRNGRGLHPKIDSNTLSAWHFDETSTTITYDKVNSNRNLAAVGALALPSVTTGRVGNAFAFNGSSQIIGRSITTSADQNLGIGECTLAIAFRLTDAPFDEQGVLFRIGGPTNLETIAFNEIFCARITRGPLSTDAPFLNFRWESGAGVDQPSTDGASLTTVPLLVGQTYVAHFIKKTNGANFDMIIAVNGRVSTVATALPQTTPGSADLGGTNRILFGACINATPAIIDPAPVQICSALFSNRAYTENECAEDFRRVAGYALPTSLHARAYLANQSDVMINVCDPALVQDDLLEALSISDSTDSPCVSSTMRLSRLVGDLSLGMQRGDSKLNNPTQAASFTPFLDAFRRFDIEIARVPHWLLPVSTDWWLKQRGRTDGVREEDESISVRGRDQGGYLVDKYISDLIVYPKTFGGGGCGGSAQAREIVIEEVLQDNLKVTAYAPFDQRAYFTPTLAAAVPGTNAAIWVPFPSASCMVPMKEGQEPELRDRPLPRGRLMDTMVALAKSIGWDFNFKKWDPLLEQFRPCVFNPNALQFAPDFVITEADLIATDGAEVSIEDVRNDVTWNYPDSSNLDANGNKLPASVNRTDIDNGIVSQARYGERGMDLTEDAGSYIDSAAEATRGADSVVQALAMPLRNSDHKIVALPELDAGDLAYFIADGTDSTINQASAVQSTSFEMNAAQSSSSIDCQGQPKPGKTWWFGFEAGKTGKNPMRNPGEAIQQKGMGSLMPMILSQLERTNWQSKSKFIDVKNGNLNNFSRGNAYPPDTWTMKAGTWGTDVVAETSESESSNRAIRLVTATAQLRSQLIPVLGDYDTPYSFEMRWMLPIPPALPGTPKVPELLIEWYDVNKTLLTSTAPGWSGGFQILRPGLSVSPAFNFPAVTPVGDTWYTSRVDGILPPDPVPGSARYMAIVIRASTNGAQTMPTGGIIVDDVSAYRTAREHSSFVLNPWGTIAGTGGWHNLNIRSATTTPVNGSHDFGNNALTYSIGNGSFVNRQNGAIQVLDPTLFLGSGFYCRENGTYIVSATCTLAVQSAGALPAVLPDACMRLIVNPTYTNAVVRAQQANTGGTVVATAASGNWVNPGSINVTGLLANSMVAVMTISQRIELQAGDRLCMEFLRSVSAGVSPNPLGSGTSENARLNWMNCKLDLTS